jgi:hypothetical protein
VWLDYKRRTAASYVEVQTKFDKVNFIVGGRAEDYNITGKTDAAVLFLLSTIPLFSQCAQYNLVRLILIIIIKKLPS